MTFTGTPTWQDDQEAHRWLTGDVFEAPDACPILWLHGYWQRPRGIVLNAGEYAQAYKAGPRGAGDRLGVVERAVLGGVAERAPSYG